MKKFTKPEIKIRKTENIDIITLSDGGELTISGTTEGSTFGGGGNGEVIFFGDI